MSNRYSNAERRAGHKFRFRTKGGVVSVLTPTDGDGIGHRCREGRHEDCTQFALGYCCCACHNKGDGRAKGDGLPR